MVYSLGPADAGRHRNGSGWLFFLVLLFFLFFVVELVVIELVRLVVGVTTETSFELGDLDFENILVRAVVRPRQQSFGQHTLRCEDRKKSLPGCALVLVRVSLARVPVHRILLARTSTSSFHRFVTGLSPLKGGTRAGTARSMKVR